VPCSGTAEREAALRLAERIDGEQRVTVGADKGNATKHKSSRRVGHCSKEGSKGPFLEFVFSDTLEQPSQIVSSKKPLRRRGGVCVCYPFLLFVRASVAQNRRHSPLFLAMWELLASQAITNEESTEMLHCQHGRSDSKATTGHALEAELLRVSWVEWPRMRSMNFGPTANGFSKNTWRIAGGVSASTSRIGATLHYRCCSYLRCREDN
jgi:hypothetical protein